MFGAKDRALSLLAPAVGRSSVSRHRSVVGRRRRSLSSVVVGRSVAALQDHILVMNALGLCVHQRRRPHDLSRRRRLVTIKRDGAIPPNLLRTRVLGVR